MLIKIFPKGAAVSIVFPSTFVKNLYVNNDNKLVVLFYENTDEEIIKKELILD